jgi:hypothetical protein
LLTGRRQTQFPLTYLELALLQNGTGKEATAAAAVVTVYQYRGWAWRKSASASSLAGSDVPSLNAVIKIVTYRGSEDDIEVIGLRMAGRL